MNLDNWEQLARDLGAIGENGNESSSSTQALRAIELLLGEDALREAVHYYIQRRPGRELLRSVLWQLHPWSAMDECYRVFRDAPSLSCKESAVELLRVVADERALPWVKEFLAHEDPRIQTWGIGVVDQLFYSELCHAEDIQELLETALKHENPWVRERAEYVEHMVRARSGRERLLEEWSAQFSDDELE